MATRKRGTRPGPKKQDVTVPSQVTEGALLELARSIPVGRTTGHGLPDLGFSKKEIRAVVRRRKGWKAVRAYRAVERGLDTLERTRKVSKIDDRYYLKTVTRDVRFNIPLSVWFQLTDEEQAIIPNGKPKLSGNINVQFLQLLGAIFSQDTDSTLDRIRRTPPEKRSNADKQLWDLHLTP